MLVLKPAGRGNWKPITLRVVGDRGSVPVLVNVGDQLQLGGVTWRICQVLP